MQINYGGKQHQLGGFASKEQAAHAYDEAAREHRKDAPLNFASAVTGAAAAQAAAAKLPKGAAGMGRGRCNPDKF